MASLQTAHHDMPPPQSHRRGGSAAAQTTENSTMEVGNKRLRERERIEELLKKADSEKVQEMTGPKAKQLCLALDRHCSKNQRMRVRTCKIYSFTCSQRRLLLL